MPTRTGLESRHPRRWGSSRSERSCSPPIPYMICSEPSPAAAAGRAGHERDELLGLVRAGADVERLERQARVADPGEAVVPVALAADRLGQRGRRGRDDRARRPVGQALEHPRADADQLPVRALVDVVLGLPGAPRLDGVVDPRRRRGRAPSARAARRSRRAPSASRSPPRSPSETSKDARIVESATSTGTPARTAIRFGPPKVRPPPSSCRKSGLTSPYSRPRRELHLELDRAGDRPRPSAAPRAGRRARARAPRWPSRERHRVAQPHDAVVGAERGLDHERAGDVAPLGAELARRPDRPVAGVRDRAAARRPPGCRSAAGRASRSSRPGSTRAAELQSASSP